MSYKKLRFITIILQPIMLPVGTLIGFELGTRHYGVALMFLGLQVALTYAEARVWWMTMERKDEYRG